MVYVLGPPLIRLIGSVVRSWWQAQCDRRRQDTLWALAAQRPDAELVDIHDVRDDGSHLHLRIRCADRDADGTAHE
jgi:hypothetical protein